MAFHFSRDTKVFMRWHATVDGTDDALYEIPVLDGFSFSQATNTSEITLNEAADGATLNSKRGRAMFNDSFAPAEWSFSTYMRPTTSTASVDTWASNNHAGSSKKFAVEGPLWGAMSAVTYALATTASSTHATGTVTAGTFEPNAFRFENSNKVALGVFDLFFVLGAAGDTATASYDTGTEGVTIYKITNCSVGSASIDFDIDGLAQVAWSGQGSIISEVAKLTTTADGAGETSKKGLINEGIGTTSTSNFIRQKLTSMTATYSAGTSTGTDMTDPGTPYVLTLTGGNITIENNLTYLTPETLGVVNQPLGHVMGTRTVSGNFTCYLNTIANGSADLFENIIEGTGQITNAFTIAFAIGGSGQTPRVDVSIPRAHLELPTHSIEDVISLDVNFHGLPGDLTDNQIAAGESEITVTYES
jgi:hypothetical protein